jgi:hypothetical protein
MNYRSLMCEIVLSAREKGRKGEWEIYVMN